jgi:hypothetical protein
MIKFHEHDLNFLMAHDLGSGSIIYVVAAGRGTSKNQTFLQRPDREKWKLFKRTDDEYVWQN